jgi:cell division protein FtsN
VAPRRSNSSPRRNPTTSGSGGKKGGSLVTGLFIGLVAGLVAAAGIAWYLSSKTPEFKSAETDLPRGDKSDTPAASKPERNSKPATAASRPPEKSESSETTSKPKPALPEKSAKTVSEPTVPESTSPIKPRVDYTFYGILPGDQPAKPMPLPVSKDIWWLQVAALKNPTDADKLKARLVLLGLEVATQKVDSGSGPLYRVRVGPYKREDDAFGDLDTLAENNFEPRLFKEPNPPAAAATVKEKP